LPSNEAAGGSAPLSLLDWFAAVGLSKNSPLKFSTDIIRVELGYRHKQPQLNSLSAETLNNRFTDLINNLRRGL